MSWTVLIAVVGVLGVALLLAIARRAELARMRDSVEERERLERVGSEDALLQHPVVDLSRCLGCATCVAVCPEDGVLELVHGQAVVVNGARCVGVSACERECPVGAITVTIANLEERTDIPVVSPELEAVGSPGLFLAGEVTAHALIKTAVDHGVAVAAEVARRVAAEPVEDEDVYELCVVGAGPAGLACSLEAKRNDLTFVTIDQEDALGGTVAKYPRRKLVMSEPVDMPLYGRFKRTTFTKEELMALWHRIADEQQLPIEHNEVFLGVDRRDDGNYVVRTERHTYVARHVCLALGRRGVPRKLGIPGEDLPKVAYSLLDANSYQQRRILVVGGGDSAVETAMGLAEQPGNQVALSYRKDSFFRIRRKNEQRLEQCLADGRLEVLYNSEVTAIRDDAVDLTVHDGAGSERISIPNDEVFVMAGGIPPFELLQNSGVSFDATEREPVAPITEQGTGLVPALAIGFVLALSALLFALWHADYYLLPAVERPAHPKHEMLRPSLSVGLWLGVAATVLILINLAYLLRRSPKIKFNLGSLQGWMTSHVATGILALLLALLHGAMDPGDTNGGNAFWALTILLVTGAIGRYFYAYVPRATNGRELELAEVKAELDRVSDEWSQEQRGFADVARSEVDKLIERGQWKGSFFGRILALVGVQFGLRRVIKRLTQRGRDDRIPMRQLQRTLHLARSAHRSSLMVAHYEDLRAVLATWRYLHRWVAALMVLLVAVHIYYALAYGSILQGGVG